MVKKILYLFLILTTLGSCNASKTFLDSKEGGDYKTKILTNCPENGICNLYVFQNSSLQIQTDGIGQSYYDMSYDAEKSVIMYEFKNSNSDYEDGNITERVVFEIKNNVPELIVEDFELSNLTMFYERHCYCKGQTGMFPIKKGKLILNNLGNTLKLNLKIDRVDVPFVIKELIAEIK